MWSLLTFRTWNQVKAEAPLRISFNVWSIVISLVRKGFRKLTSNAESVLVRMLEKEVEEAHLVAWRQATASVWRAEDASRNKPCLWITCWWSYTTQAAPPYLVLASHEPSIWMEILGVPCLRRPRLAILKPGGVIVRSKRGNLSNRIRINEGEVLLNPCLNMSLQAS